MSQSFEIRSDELPAASKIKYLFEAPDFSECYSSTKIISEKVVAPLAFKKLFENPPFFVLAILKIRDLFFKVGGLKTASDITNPIQFVDLPIERDHPIVSDMYMTYNSYREVIWGLKDTHLDFAVSVFVTNTIENSQNLCKVFISTRLKYNNNWGRVYFLTIRLIHSFIIKSMFKKLMSSL